MSRRSTHNPSHLPAAPRGFEPSGLMVVALIFAVTLAAYFPALRATFIWNDPDYVTAPDLRSWAGLGRIWFEVGATQQYYPALHTAFWVEQGFFGANPFGYHLINILLHATAASLVFAALRRFTIPGAWLAGVLFAVHPVCAESVAWISEEKNTLSTVFYLLSAIAYSRFEGERTSGRYALALGLFLLAVLTKSVAATLPGALLVMIWWRDGRISWSRDVQPMLPFFAIGAAAGILTGWVERRFIGAEGHDFVLTFAERLLVAGRGFWFYAGKALWPADLVFIYPRWHLDTSDMRQWLYPVAAIALFGGLWIYRHQARWPLAAALFFVGSLFPTLGFFNVYAFLYSFVTDHWQYLALIGMVATLAALAATAQARWLTASGPRLAWHGGVALVVAGLATLTWHECLGYQQPDIFYRTIIARNPASWLAHNNLGQLLLEQPGRESDAVAEFQAALQLKPDCFEAHSNLVTAYGRHPDRLADAKAHFEEAVRLEPRAFQAYHAWGNALLFTPGRERESTSCFEKAVQINPRFAEAHMNLATSLRGRPEYRAEMFSHYETARRLNPDSAVLYNNLAIALLDPPANIPEAIANYEKAVALKPDLAEAHCNLGSLLYKIPGRLPEAIQHCETAVKLRPEVSAMHLFLAHALALSPERWAEAIPHYEIAVRADPNSAAAQYNLGVLLGRLPNRESDATAHLEAAARLEPNWAAPRDLLAARKAAASR